MTSSAFCPSKAAALGRPLSSLLSAHLGRSLHIGPFRCRSLRAQSRAAKVRPGSHNLFQQPCNMRTGLLKMFGPCRRSNSDAVSIAQLSQRQRGLVQPQKESGRPFQTRYCHTGSQRAYAWLCISHTSPQSYLAAPLNLCTCRRALECGLSSHQCCA